MEMQDERRCADHDPSAQFIKLDVSSDVLAVESAITEFKSAPVKHRRAFCAYIFF